MAKLEGWSTATQGLVLSAFYWGYIVLQLPGSWVANQYGPKVQLSFSFLRLTLLSRAFPAGV